MTLITLLMMVCSDVNRTIWCAEPPSSRIEVSIPSSKIEALEDQEYVPVPDTDPNTVAEVIYGNKVKKPALTGCKLSTDAGREYFYESSCGKLRKIIGQGGIK